MQAKPLKVKNVTIYPFLNIPPGGGPGPVVLAVVKDGAGKYGIGTLTTNIFYNLDIASGDIVGDLVLHGMYIAYGEYEDGTSFTTPWMYCTEVGGQPKFGRTISMTATDQPHANSLGVSVPEYIDLGPLTDINVTYTLTPPAVGTVSYVQEGTGNSIATRVGTPHEMGVEVTKAKHSGGLKAGMKGLMVSGKNKDGKTVVMGNMTCISAEFPLVFLREWM